MEKIFDTEFSAFGGLEQFTRFSAYRPDGSLYAVDDWPFMRSLLRGEFVRDEEMHIKREDGSLAITLVSSMPTKDNKGIIIIIKDITGQRALTAALRDAEENTHSLLNVSSIASVVIDTEGAILALNNGFAARHGLLPHDMVGRCIYNFHPPTLARKLKSRHREAIRKGKQVRFEFQRMGRCLDSNIYPVPDESGRVKKLVIQSYDITDRKQMEEALRVSEEKFAKAFALNPAAIVMTNLEDGRIIDMNETGLKMFGYSRDEVMGASINPSHWPTPEDRDRFVHELRHNGYFPMREQMLARRSGERFVALVSAQVLTVGDEKVAFSTLLDITGRKQMEEELRRSRDELEMRVQERTAQLNRLAAAVENVTEAVIITDPSWHIVYTNPAFTRCTGYTANEAAGRELSFLRSKSVDRSIYDKHRKSALEDRPYTDQHSIRKKDGSHLTVESVMSRLKDDTGKTANYVLVWRDVSERLRLEEQLRQSHKMEAIGTLAGGIAHDFNNMLAVILGNAELALDDHELGAIRRNLMQIIEASKRSRDLVRQILTFSRKSEGDRKPLKLIPIVRETAQLLRGSLPTTISVKVDIRTESDAMIGNTAQLQQVIMNLATNAAHAMRKDGGTLAIRLSEKMFAEGEPMPDRDLRPGSYLKLTVRDTGTGIPPRIREHIFEPFFTTKDQGEGTGMGLAVVYGIVKSHEGAITFASKVGKGSVFSIFFPSAREGSEETGIRRSPNPMGRERLLVVDDEEGVLHVVSETLRRLGYQVTGARSGGEGWKAFERDPDAFDLVITDHVMPRMTGMRLAEMIRAARPDLPIVLFTGYSETVSAEQTKAAGIAAFIMKPVDTGEMADTVRQVLDEHSAQASGAR